MIKVWIALLALVGMLAWVVLLVWIAVADWSSSSQLLERRWMMATQFGRAAHKSLHRFWHPEYIVRGIAAILGPKVANVSPAAR
jgi:hypothetical protein